jgi:hypothetical protein
MCNTIILLLLLWLLQLEIMQWLLQCGTCCCHCRSRIDN